MKKNNFAVKNLDWEIIVEKIRYFSTAEITRFDLVETLKPLETITQAEKSFYEIECASLIIASGIRPHMESLDLFEIWYLRLKKNAVLKLLELKDVRHFILEILALKESLKINRSAWATEIHDQIFDAEEPLSAIDQLMTPNSEIRMDASEKLYHLSREKDQLAKQIQHQMDRLVKDQDIEHMLQERYVTTREGRWVLPIKGGLKHFVPGVVHASSQSKQTVFIEPETIIPQNNRLRQIDVDIEEEIERLLIEISNYLCTQKNNFEVCFKILKQTDLLFAKAQLSTQIGAKACRLDSDENAFIDLKDLYHPLLTLAGKKPITNSLYLDSKKSILLLSGPNAGGKTVLLKALGLAAQMARCGLPICANKNSSIPFFENISTTIGDAQSVDEDLSTFAAHLKSLDQAVQLKNFKQLILVDEICGSTDPEEGSALARAFINEYAKNNVYGIITSHLSPLKTGWSSESQIQNGSLEYDLTSGKPSYQFLAGIAGDSLAILTAQRVGVNQSILNQAHEYLSPLAKQKISQLEDIENLKKDISNLQNRYKKDLKDLEHKKNELDEQIKQFENKKDKELEKALKQAHVKVENAISEITAKETLDKHRKIQEIKFNLPEIVKGQQSLSTTTVENSNSKILTVQDFAEKYPAGTKVFVTRINQDGIVQSAPNSKGEVFILSQSLRLQIHWSELKPAHKAGNPTNQLVRKSGAQASAFIDHDRVLDLRGQTVEKALTDLENNLDLATMQKEDRIKIIHGHGTDTLKKSIRSYLSRSVYVKKWKAGTPESGGDGITWVELG